MRAAYSGSNDNAAVSGGAASQPVIFFLTDGHATAGETDDQAILANALAANGGQTSLSASVFCLAFGRQADFSLLKVLALQNHGFARKIYVAADAALQLEGFYKEVRNDSSKGFLSLSVRVRAMGREGCRVTPFRTDPRRFGNPRRYPFSPSDAYRCTHGLG